ncbi:MAG: cupin domain-containing protein [Dysosmobacter welbionis]
MSTPLATLVPHPGEGYFLIDKEQVPEFGTWVHVPGGVRHNFGNTGKGQLMALCIVPPEGCESPERVLNCLPDPAKRDRTKSVRSLFTVCDWK